MIIDAPSHITGATAREYAPEYGNPFSVLTINGGAGVTVSMHFKPGQAQPIADVINRVIRHMDDAESPRDRAHLARVAEAWQAGEI